MIPKADRKKIHEYLFREGVLVAKKDFNQPKHNEIDTKNLYVRLPSNVPVETIHSNKPFRSSKPASPSPRAAT